MTRIPAVSAVARPPIRALAAVISVAPIGAAKLLVAKVPPPVMPVVVATAAMAVAFV
jgi:hypothetical protein